MNILGSLAPPWRSRLRTSAIGLLGLYFSISARPASLERFGFRTIQSRSRQFAVTWKADDTAPRLTSAERDRGLISIDPELAVLSAERIKTAILWELSLPDTWRGKIRFTMNTKAPADRGVLLQSIRYSSGWKYHLWLPAKMNAQRWQQALVQAILLELANRLASERSAEIPFWVVEGMSREVTESALGRLIFSRSNIIPPGLKEPRLARPVPALLRKDPIADALAYLRTHSPLKAAEFLMPDKATVTGPKRETFGYCCQLFLNRLLALPAGKVKMRRFLETLPEYWNWQYGFYEVYAPRFQRTLDLEKWWAVQLEDLRSFGSLRKWPHSKSLSRLSEILRPDAKVGVHSDELPRHRRFTLQELVVNWDLREQRTAIDRIRDQLRILRGYASEAVAALADEYRQTLGDYLVRRARTGYQPVRRGQPTPRAQRLVRATIRQLNRLDAKRRQLARALVVNPKSALKPEPPGRS